MMNEFLKSNKRINSDPIIDAIKRGNEAMVAQACLAVTGNKGGLVLRNKHP